MESVGYELFVPDSHYVCELSNFDWEQKEPLRLMVDELLLGKRKKGLVLIGDPGVGKTHLIVGMFKEALRKDMLLGKDVMFRKWSDLVQDMQLSITQNLFPERVLESSIASLFLLDDVRPVGGKLWNDVLKKVIELVYERELVGVLSTNANSVDDLVRLWQLEDYYLSRLLGCFDIVLVRGRDRRVES